MIPKFFNPHLLPQDYQPVLRSQIYYETSLGLSIHDGYEEEYAILKDILDAQFQEPAEKHRPKKRKRASSNPRKIDEAENAVDVDFRLISGDPSPKRVCLRPELIKPQKPAFIDASLEDTGEEQAIRHERAAKVAVESSGILQWSIISYPQKQEKVQRTIASSSSKGTETEDLELSTLILIQVTPSSGPLVSESRTLIDAGAEKHEIPGHPAPQPQQAPSRCKLPILPVELPEAQHRTLRKRRGLSQPQRHKPAQFFRPSFDLGGKSAGYAWGYRDSKPIRPSWGSKGIVRGKYIRDTMKVGAVELSY